MVDTPPLSSAAATALGTPWCPITGLAAAEHLLAATTPDPGSMFLDVVAGLGHCAGLAARCGAVATGIDTCEQRLDTARRNYPQALFYTGTPGSLVFADGFFAVLTHHAGPGGAPSFEALAEAYRVLLPGGRYAALCWGAPTSRKGSTTELADSLRPWEEAGFGAVCGAPISIALQPPQPTSSAAPATIESTQWTQWTAIVVTAIKPS